MLRETTCMLLDSIVLSGVRQFYGEKKKKPCSGFIGNHQVLNLVQNENEQEAGPWSFL